MKKKLLFMVSGMNVGGVEKSLLSLLSVIPKGKYDITILLLDKKGGFLEYIPDWIRIEEAKWFKRIEPIIMQPPQKTIKDYYRKREYIKLLTFIYSYFVSKKFNNRYVYYKEVFKDISVNMDLYDIAIAYQGPTDIIDYYIANKVRAVKKISWVHFDVSQHMINDKLYDRLYQKFDKIFVVSKEARARLIDKVPKIEGKAYVFPNVIANNSINEWSKETVEFDSSYNGTKIVTVGRLSKEKGQDIAIKTLSRLRRDGYEVRWYCIGEGSSRGEYEKLIDEYNLKSDFILLGEKTNPYPYIEKADIYVQTSRHEGYCLTLAEAKCLHKPIVTTNFIGAFEQIVDGFNGLIVEFDDEELYKNIKNLIDNPKVQEKFVQNLINNNQTSNKGEVEKIECLGI